MRVIKSLSFRFLPKNPELYFSTSGSELSIVIAILVWEVPKSIPTFADFSGFIIVVRDL